MSKKPQNHIIVSRYSLYLMANPDATRQEFMVDTGGKIKDWYNSRDRVRGLTLRDKGIRLPQSKAIIHMMINPKTTKEAFVRAGFSPDSFVQSCIRARDLLVACNAAATYITNLNATLANTAKPEKKKVIVLKKKPVDLPVFKPTPRLQPITEPTNCVDHSDLVLKIQSGVAELINEMNDQQTEINTYRSRITTLNAENFRLRSEIAELTEMINGPSK